MFCERYPTAFYIEEFIKKQKPNLNIFCTIERKKTNKNFFEYKPKSLKIVEKAIIKFAPIANNINPNEQDSYDVFITTDNYGIGVNMQDASVVINYDIAWTPIEPIQRAGRILRLWDDFRIVKIYTFVPMLSEKSELQKELLDVRKRWDNLMIRHEESRKLTDLPVITSEENELINMPDFAPDTIVTKGHLTLKTEDDKDVSPFYQHTYNLHFYREQAEGLENDLISALNYDGESVLLYLLLKCNNEYKIVLYDCKKNKISSPHPEKILNLIRCEPPTHVAVVDMNEVEKIADLVIQKWCEEQKFIKENIERICTLYLKPVVQDDSLDNLLKN
ncbi:C-terminal helicase domain-containing protein [Cyanobacterium aponinum]|uniref:C-terminal helicase domain-containing protein n=1 Tax=Cyanobacterium aponinum TaxID=379064 RepID=UPI0030CE7836